MRKHSLKTLAAIALLFWAAFAHAQNGDAAAKQRLDAIYADLQRKVFPIKLQPAPCQLDRFRELAGAQPDMKKWLREVWYLRSNGAPHCSFQLLEQLRPIAEKGDSESQMRWKREEISGLLRAEKLDSALAAAKALTVMAEKNGQFLAEAYLTEARARSDKLQFWETYALAEKALADARARGEKRLEAEALEMVGDAARDIYQIHPEKSDPYLLESLKIARSLNDTAFIISELIGLSLHNYDTHFDRALDFLEQAVAILPAQPTARTKLDVIRMLGICSDAQNDRRRSIELMTQAVEIAKFCTSRSLVQNIYEHISSDYYALGQFDMAQTMLDSALVYCNFQRQLGYLFQSLGEVAAARGDLKTALKHYQRAFDEQIKSYNARSTIELSEWETRFRTREKELQIEEQKRQRWLLIGLAAAMAALFAGAVLAVFQQRKSRKALAEQHAVIEKQAAELRRLDEAKSRFFANISHELRTPLTLMLGPLASMLKREKLDPRDAALAQTAQQHGKQLLNLVNEILDLSKMESGKMRVQETTVSLQPFLRRIASAFESHAERLGVGFFFEYKAEQRLRLALDADKVSKVLNNLISNALKFTPKGGEVSVAVSDLGNRLQIAVRDTGRGIHPDDLPHVFERFYQTNQTDAPIEGGTGIGLALCREFAELLQGRIWAESRLGAGSAFVFEFPKKEALGVAEDELESMPELPQEEMLLASAALQNAAAADPNRQTILIVEDNHSLRDYVRLVLSDKFRVLAAENGRAALDVLGQQANAVNLIVSDIMMPVMDGFQLLENLKGDPRWRQIPVVMLTARADASDKLRALRIGVDDYLLKPFEEDELLARVENLLKNAAGRSVIDGAAEPNEPAASDSPSTALRPPSTEELAWLSDLEKTVEREIGSAHFNADLLAEKLFMSRTKFFQQMKRLTGMTPNEYILEVRFRTARALLETRQTSSVKASAAAVGFRDVEYFSRQFRAKFGKPPSEYLN